jgi:hypothetical protein
LVQTHTPSSLLGMVDDIPYDKEMHVVRMFEQAAEFQNIKAKHETMLKLKLTTDRSCSH